MPSQERLARLHIKESIGGPPKTPSGPVTFVETSDGGMAAQADQHTRNAFGSVTVDGKTVSQKLDEFLRGVVEQRCADLNALDKIPVVLARRIEVAVNAAVDGLRVEMVALARARMVERIKAAVDALPLNVAVQIGGAA